MNKLFLLTLLFSTVLVSCGDPTSSDNLPTSDNSTTSDSAPGSNGEGEIVGNPIAPGEVPAFVDIYFNPGGVNFTDYQLWLWDDGGTDGAAFNWDNIEGDWAMYRVNLAKFSAVHGLGIIIRGFNSWGFQTGDGFIRFSEFGEG